MYPHRLGATWKPVMVFSAGTRNVLEAMRHEGVRRLLVKPLLLNTIYADKDRQEAPIQASEADLTIVRPGFLTNGPLTKKYRVISDLSGVTAGKISRADVADFILEELAANRCLRQSLLLTY